MCNSPELKSTPKLTDRRMEGQSAAYHPIPTEYYSARRHNEIPIAAMTKVFCFVLMGKQTNRY